MDERVDTKGRVVVEDIHARNKAAEDGAPLRVCVCMCVCVCVCVLDEGEETKSTESASHLHFRIVDPQPQGRTALNGKAHPQLIACQHVVPRLAHACGVGNIRKADEFQDCAGRCEKLRKGVRKGGV